VICPGCATENIAGAKFCIECGTAMARACPSCGAQLQDAAKFCAECGTPLVGSAEQPVAVSAVVAPAPIAERRLVSVLFADLVGFTALSESRDAEEVRELLSRYFEACRRLIELYGGTVEKFIGDAVMAVWGTPVATEDDAERAVRAGLDLVAAVSALGDEVGAPELRARAGVLTGEAAVTLGATGEGMVAGDLVNTASRIQSAAEPGTVLVGDSTKRATEETVAYEAAGSHELKGKVGLVPLHRALRVVSGARGALKSSGLEAPFVGRDRELRQIKDLFHACADEGKAHLISITGIAGIGKSRLAWEFYKYFDGIAQTTYWHRGRCLSYGEGVTYWALADMVRMRARIAEDEEPGSAREKLAAVVEETLPDEEERRFVEPRLAHLLALEEGRYERDDLFAAWRLFFERLAAVYPAVMVFEDMQWADASLLDFIEHLLEWSRNSPIYVVTHARPELLERRPTWGAGHRNFTSIYLEPLSEPAMQELLAGLVPGLPEALRTQILARAEGIPLYAVETVRMLLDRGALVQDGPAYRLTAAVETLEVPETLHALIAARLDGLPPDERRVIQDAAVLGKTFTKHALAALANLAETELDPILSSLTRKEVLGVQSDPRSPEHGQYGFLQDLLRKVAYDTLARADRKQRHLAAATLLEQGWSEQEVVEVVASHYLAAYNAAPDANDANEIKDHARERLSRAGDRAASLGANEEAERYYTQAAQLTNDPHTRAQLHEQAGRTAWKAARATDAAAHLERAIGDFESLGLTHPAARASAALAEITWQEGNIEDAIATMEAAFAVLSQENEEDEDLATIAAQLARLLFFAGRLGDALNRVESALSLAEALALAEVFAQALQTKGMILGALGRPEEGLTLTEKALQVALEHDLSSVALRAYQNLQAFMFDLDRLEGAPALAVEALALARRTGNRLLELRNLASQLNQQVVFGSWSEAVALGDELRAMPDLPGLARLELMNLVPILVGQGRIVAAREVLTLVPEGESSGDVQTRVYYLAMLAQVLRAEGRLEEALAAAEEAYAGRSELGLTGTVKASLVETFEAASSLGDLDKCREVVSILDALRPGEVTPYLRAERARLHARLDGSDAAFKTSVASFRELGWPFWLGVALVERAEWFATEGRAPEAETLLAEAREIFEKLEARPWLERVDAHAEVPA